MNDLKAPSLQSLLESDHGSNDSLLAESLQLDIEDLDDIEYSIPPTGALPTLESVLNDIEHESDVVSELGLPIPTPTPSIAEDSAVRGSGGSGGGSIMRYNMMQGISAQVSSAAERVNSGLATAFAVGAYFVVGTSHGHILNFDVTQTLRWAHQDKSSQGAVSTLSYNPESTRLLAGYARGLITMFDINSGDILRQITDAMTPNTGVLHVKWTSRPALALCADSGGSVWSLSFTRKLGIRGYSSRCLFSGSRGEVCAVEPLVMSPNSHHELDQYCIVALATLSKYFIVIIRPRLRVIKFHPLTGPPDCLPVLSWQMVLIQAADTSRSVDPVIVVGRGNQLFFHQLFVSNGRITLLFLRHVQMQANILSAHWLGPKCVGCMDTSEIFHLIDVRSSKELECIDMANAGLVYNSAQFKGLATGGNVSPALALAGTHACYNSIGTRGTQLYILGSRSLHMISVRTWSERITYLVKYQRWQEACDLALEGYKAAVDRPKRKAHAKERIIMLFKEYVAICARASDYCLGAIVKCLIAIDELDLLWSELWDRLQNTELFLQHISEHIENESIHQINPTISQALVDHWLLISPEKLEDIILKLDWTCLDLNQVLKASKRYKLFRAQIYLNTHALNDYTISLTELIPLISTEDPDLGNSLLVYISSCLAGRGYPNGDIPPEQIHSVKHEVLRCLTSVHSAQAPKDELPYPLLRALLKFDTRETLNVISLAFQEKEFSGELGLSYRKRIINILLDIMTPENATWAEIGCLLNFIAQQISQQCLPFDTQLLENVLSYLAQENIENETIRQHSERESAWHELLVNNCLEHITTDEEQLKLARKAKCFYVEEYLLEKMKRYDTILECYINNSLRHETLFSYIERYANQADRCIYNQMLQNFYRLIEINPKETTRIVDLHFRNYIKDFLQSLESYDNLIFIFLQHLHKRHLKLPSGYYEKYLKLLCERGLIDEVDIFLKSPQSYYDNEKALKIVQQHDMTEAAIYLAEKKKNYKLAFEMAMGLLAHSDPSQVEHYAREVTSLCSRASCSLHFKESEEYWFKFVKHILPREDLSKVTKTILHEASQHVDLLNLVQLIMNTHNVSGSFGDIKDLLMSMLTNSRYETKALETTINILGHDMHELFIKARKESSRGLYVTSTRCAKCQNRLYNQKDNVIVLGVCGHALHEDCINKLIEEDKSKVMVNKNNYMRLHGAEGNPASNLIIDDFYNEENMKDGKNDENEDELIMQDRENDKKEINFKCPKCQEEVSLEYLNQPMQLATIASSKVLNQQQNLISTSSAFVSPKFNSSQSSKLLSNDRTKSKAITNLSPYKITSDYENGSTNDLGILNVKAPPFRKF